MKAWLFALGLASVAGFAAETPSPAPWNGTISSEQGEYFVSVMPREKKVEVKKVGGADGTPPHLRVRMLRPGDRPLELRLKTVERVNSPLYYTGTFSKWNDSYTGLEVDFSFDKKTWKRLGNTLKKVLP